MKDEIKEILNMLKTDMIYIRLFKEDRKKLLDYITNLQKELKLKTNFIEELLTIISVARDYELHDKCYTRSKIYQDKLKELKENKMNNTLFLVLYNKDKKFTFTKYFDTEFIMDKFKRKLPYINNLLLIEDSRDIYFFGGD